MRKLLFLVGIVALPLFVHGQWVVNGTTYSFRNKLTINGSQVCGSTALTNFPVLIQLTSNKLKVTGSGGLVSNANGYDIVFTSSDQVTKLDHQIDHYVGTTGDYGAWVRLPSLPAGTGNDTDIYMYYGSSSVSGDPSLTTTWDANFKTIYHFQNSNFNDATSYAINSTNNGTTNNAGAWIGDARTFDGTASYIQSNSSELKTDNNFTVSVWFKATSTAASHLLWQGENTSPINGWGTNNTAGESEMNLSLGDCCPGNVTVPNKVSWYLGDREEQVDVNVMDVNTAFTDVTSWHYLVGTISNMSTGPTATLYLDGALIGANTGIAETSGSVTDRSTWATNLKIGRPNAAQRYFNGSLDEVRISNVVRSSNWVCTEYNNQSNTSSFFTFANRAPDLSGIEGTALNYTEDDAATAISSTLTAADWDNNTFQSATVSITSGFVSTEDVLSFTNAFGITFGSYSGGVLTLNGPASISNFISALRSVTYSNTNHGSPSTTTRVISFQVNDGTSLSNIVTRNITITLRNDAPVLSGTNNFTAINQDNFTSAGTLVSALIAGQVTDADASPLTGIAVTGVVTTNGVWQYTTDGGTTWTAFGAVSNTSAQLLTSNASTSIRFVPNAGYSGNSSITYRAWDQTSGTVSVLADVSVNGGITPYSTATATPTITVYPAAPTGSASQSFCSALSPKVSNLTATGAAIQWYSASSGGSPLATTTALTTATTYYATQTVGGLESVNRFAVTVTIVSNPAAPTGTAAQSFCAINNPTIANLAATGTAIQWYSASSGGAALASTTSLTTATTYYASQTAGGCESTSRFAVTVTINNPAVPTGTAAQSFCAISNPTVANLTATGTAIQWDSASSGGSALASTTALTTATTYYASQTVGGCESASRFAVTVTIASPAAPTGTAAQSFCAINNPTVANLAATGTAIQWYSASSGGSALASTAALTTATTYYASQTVGGCESASRFAVTVTINNPAAPTGTAAQGFCAINNPTVANLAATGTAIQWYSASSGGSALASTTALTTATTYYGSQTVSGCESSSRFAVTVTINNPSAPTGTAAQSFCAINSPTVANLVATGTAIQWYSASSGGSALATTTALTTATTYYASQTVGGCESTSRFAVTVTIASPAAPTGTAAQSFCAINNPTVANLAATGSAIQWYSASIGGSALASTAALTTATTYYASQTVGGCESASRFAVTVTINNPAAPTGIAAQSFCAINNPTVVNLAATGTAIQWYSASSGGSPLATTTALTNSTTYYASQTVGGCESASRFAVTVTIASPAAPTGTAAQSFCAINNPTVANLAATGTAIQWYSASSGGSPLATTAALTTATTYYASQTVGSCESASRFAVAVTINNSAAPTGTPAQSFCAINSPTVANLTSTGTAIQWYSASSGGSALASTTALTTATTYYASQTVGSCESASRFAVTVTINNPAVPTGTAAQSFCAINSPTVVNLAATGTAIQWYIASSGGSALVSTTALTTATTYYASQTVGGCESASRLAVTVTINNPAAPTGTAAQSFCAINNPTVTNLTATGTAIQWYSASSGGSALATTTALTTTTYYASQTVGGCESASRFAVTVTINNPAAPTGTAAQSFCAINNPTVANLTATGTAIQWYSASTGGSALASTIALTTATIYYASQTVGGCESASRFAVTVTINNLAAPTGTAAQSFCSIDNPTISSLAATGSAIQWYSTSTGGSALSGTAALATATTYYGSQIVSGCESATRLAVTVTISIPSAPTGMAAQSFCAINSPTVANLAATGSSIKWYSASSGGSPLATTTALTNATTYYASQTVESCESASRFAVTVTINNPAAPTGTAAQSFCTVNNPTVANLTATGTAIQWYSASSGGSALASTTALTTATTYYGSQTVSGCESTSRFAVTVTINNPAAPTGTAAQSFCAINNPTVTNLTATGTAIQWYSASSGGSALASTTALITATTYYASQTVGGCESTSRFAVTVTINNPAAPTGTAAQSFCAVNNPTVANLTATGTAIQWYSASSGGSALASTTALTTATTYHASQTVGGCESASRFAVTVTIASPAAPTGTAAQSFCAINSPTVASLVATGTAIHWYSATSGGSALATTTALTTATTYYASQTVGGCESASRFAVTVTISNPSAPAGTAAQSFCSIDNPTISSLVAIGSAIQWYSTSTGGSALSGTAALATATTYYASQNVSGCESATRLAVTVTISIPSAPTGTAAQSFCALNSPTVANLVATGSSIKWYSASSGGSALASTTALTTATTYYASQTVGSCESASRFAVTVTINNPAAPTGTAGQSFCAINNPTVANLAATGTAIQWYSASSGGSALASTTALTTATTYYASQTVGSCESASRFAVTVTINNPAAPTGTAGQSFCAINNPTVANLAATGTAIQWYSASSGGSALASTIALTTTTTYYASQTVGGCESASRFAVTVTINNPAAPTGTAAQSFCAISNPTVANLTATGNAIQWYSASSGGSALAITTALTTATTYYASQTVGGCESASRFAATVTINNPAAPTGSAAQSFCAINNPTVANLTATGTVIQWYSASSGGSALASTTALTTATTYYASQTVGGCESTSRFAVTVTINNPAAPTGTAAQSFCAINNPTVANLSATGTAIQWYSASSGGSALASTTALTTATTYYASQTVGGCESTSRFAVTVTINNPAAPTGTAAQSFCAINNPTVANLAATGTAIQWYSASSGGSALATTTALTTATTYYASQTVGGCESTSRFAVTVTINNPAAPTGTAAQSFCAINSPSVANLAATGTAIQWYSTSSGGSALATTTALTTATTYYASQTVGGCESASRFAVTVTINNPAAPTGTAAQGFCAINNPTVANLTATGTTIQWYSASSGGSALALTTALTTATTYYASQTVGGCESASRFAVTVTINNPAAPTGTATQSFCSINNPTVANLAATGTAIQWYIASSGGSALASTTALTTATTYYASQTVGGCESASRFAVTVTINNPAAPTGTTAQSFCAINNPTVANLAATGTAIQWYSASSGGSALASTAALTTATTYYASQTVGSCESASRFAVTVTINNPAAPTGTAAQSFNSTSNPSIADLIAAGTFIQWYSSPSGGSALASTMPLTAATYYASQTVAGCESVSRFGVVVAINHPPSDIALTSSTIDENQPAGMSIGNFSSTDPDVGDTFSYTLVAGPGSTDNASFAIATNVLQSASSFDFETKNTYSIRIRTTDASGLFFEKVFTITINNVNEAPTDISLSSSSVDENLAAGTTVGNFSSTDVDAGDTFTYSLVAGAGSMDNAVFIITAGVLRTNMMFDFETKNSYSIRVRSTDAGGLFFEKVFTIFVNNVNEAPLATNDNATTNEDTAINIDVLSNDTDVDNAIDPTTVTILTPSTNGTISINPSTGVVTYTPNLNYNGNDSFTYTVKDIAAATSNIATVTIVILPVNDAPVANSDAVTTPENTGIDISVLVNDTDVDSALDPTTVVIVSGALHGTLVIDPGTGTIKYTPSTGYYGIDSFTYTVRDAGGLISNVATVTITVIQTDVPPVAVDDGPILIENIKPFVIDVLANDYDPDGSSTDLSILSVSSATMGSVTIENGKIIYQAYKNVSGDDHFTYIIQDAMGLTDTATVTIHYEYLELQVSQGFSPNGDGNNDTWYIKSIENYANNSIKVFDRWGMTVYEAQPYDNSKGWNGHANTGQQSGKMLEEDTYYYILNAGDKTLSGFITLVR